MDIETKIVEKLDDKVQFTGNWFVDAGILGFVNLMEEVYGWDLNKLQEMIIKEPEKVYYGYFPFGYIYNSLLFQLSKLKKIPHKDEINKNLSNGKKEFIRKISSCVSSNCSDIFNKTWEQIDLLTREIWIEKKLAIVDEDKLKILKLEDERNFGSFKHDVLEIKDMIISNEKKIRAVLKKKASEKIFFYELLDAFPGIKRKLDDLKNKLSDWWNKKTEDDKKRVFFRVPISNNFFTNFLIFQESWGYKKQKEGLKDLIDFNISNQPTFLGKLDKTVNKFLPSEEEFLNINYTKFSTETLRNQLKYLFVYLLCFIYAFEKYKNIGNVIFYSNDLEFSYVVNKRLRLYKKNLENSKDPNVIFKVTWQQIINTLVEYKSSWSLENMYIISYQKLDNQAQEGVEYIGIPKLHASILLDNTIRENLNKTVQFRSKNEKCWLLEEFIKGKSLYPTILNHINLVLNENDVYFNRSASLYSLLVDANVLDFKSNKKTTLFSADYFDNYISLVNKIKEDIRFASFKAGLINQISKDTDKKNRFARELVDALSAKNKNIFLNILLKNMNENGELCANPNLNNWIFDKIIKNDRSFEMYGLILTMNLLRGEKNE